MKVKLKTKEKLLKDGCTYGSLNKRYGYYGIYVGTKKEPTVVCSLYQEKNLGKIGILLEAQMDRDEPQVKVKVGNHTSWYPWFILEDYDLSTYKDKRIQKTIAGGTATYCPIAGFKFSCRLSELSKSDAKRLADWVLKVVSK